MPNFQLRDVFNKDTITYISNQIKAVWPEFQNKEFQKYAKSRLDNLSFGDRNNLIKTALNEYLPPLVDAGIDALIMGCTHYPLAFNAIRRHLPSRVAIVDPAHEAVFAIREKMVRQGIVNDLPGTPVYEFVTSTYREDFKPVV